MADCIRREAVQAIIERKQKELCPVGQWSRNAVYGRDRDRFDELQEVLDEIEAIPAADVVPVVRGKWVSAHDFMPISACSICGKRPLFRNGDEVYSNYCPECGARMEIKNE